METQRVTGNALCFRDVRRAYSFMELLGLESHTTRPVPNTNDADLWECPFFNAPLPLHIVALNPLFYRQEIIMGCVKPFIRGNILLFEPDINLASHQGYLMEGRFRRIRSVDDLEQHTAATIPAEKRAQLQAWFASVPLAQWVLQRISLPPELLRLINPHENVYVRQRPLPEEQPEKKRQRKILKEAEPCKEGEEACITCLEHRKSICFVPCGHQVMCDSCTQTLLDNYKVLCPICRDPVESVVRPIQ
jgi:Zinc finger, C3HC4 type (RING finger)